MVGDLQRRPRDRAQRIDRRLSRVSGALSRPARVGRRAVQRQQRRGRRSTRTPSRTSIWPIGIKPSAPPTRDPCVDGAAKLDAVAGLYRDTTTGEPLTHRPRQGRVCASSAARRSSRCRASRFVTGRRQTGSSTAAGVPRDRSRSAPSTRFERVAPAHADRRAAQELAGTYVSDEAEDDARRRHRRRRAGPEAASRYDHPADADLSRRVQQFAGHGHLPARGRPCHRVQRRAGPRLGFALHRTAGSPLARTSSGR